MLMIDLPYRALIRLFLNYARIPIAYRDGAQKQRGPRVKNSGNGYIAWQRIVRITLVAWLVLAVSSIEAETSGVRDALEAGAI